MKRQKITLLTTALLIGAFCVSPFTAQTAMAAKAKVTKVSVTNLPTKNLTLKKKKKFTLKVKVNTKGNASKAVTFKSSNKKIVKVTSKGKLTAKKKGKATITITSKANKKKNVKIKVIVGTPATKVTLNSSSLSIAVNGKKQLTATVSPKTVSNSGIVWSSSNAKIASVSNGVVTGHKAGTVTITALAADGSGKKATTKVTVGAAVNSVTMDAKKSINEGSTGRLVATVLPANAIEKKLKWHSSNTGIVTVDQNGSIKAVKAGTAVITAEAIDGSGKKATCTITVIKPVTVVAANFVSYNMLHIQLSEPYKLKKDNVTAMVKMLAAGKYNTKAKITAIHTTDNQNYYIDLYNYLGIGDYLKATINGLRGNPSFSFEICCTPSLMPVESYSSIKSSTRESLYSYLYLYGCGYSSIQIDNLPEELYYTTSYDNYGLYMQLRGKISKKGTYSFTIRYTDELGTKYVKHVTCVIYDPNEFSVSTSAPLEDTSQTCYFYPLGTYDKSNVTCSFVGESYGLKINKSSNSSDSISFYITGKFNATKSGSYPLTLHFETTKDDQTYEYDYKTTYHYTAPCILSGTIVDLNNNPVRNVMLNVVKLSSGNTFRYNYNYIITNSDGKYSFELPAGEYYINISHPLTKIYSSANYKLTQSKTQNFTADLLTINVEPNENLSNPSHYTWRDENNLVTYLSSDGTMIVRPGQHTYTAYSSSDDSKFTCNRYSISGNFTKSTKTAKIKVERDIQVKGAEMILDKTQIDKLNNSCPIYHTFTPTEDGTYYFYSSKDAISLDTYGIIYTKNGDYVASSDYGLADSNFCVTAELKKGETYYLGAMLDYFNGNSYYNYDFDNIDHDRFSNAKITISKKMPKYNIYDDPEYYNY